MQGHKCSKNNPDSIDPIHPMCPSDMPQLHSPELEKIFNLNPRPLPTAALPSSFFKTETKENKNNKISELLAHSTPYIALNDKSPSPLASPQPVTMKESSPPANKSQLQELAPQNSSSKLNQSSSSSSYDNEFDYCPCNMWCR